MAPLRRTVGSDSGGLGGLPPRAVAERVFEAVREGRFYILPPEGDPFRDACNTRLAQIRTATNPGANLPDDMPGSPEVPSTRPGR